MSDLSKQKTTKKDHMKILSQNIQRKIKRYKSQRDKWHTIKEPSIRNPRRSQRGAESFFEEIITKIILRGKKMYSQIQEAQWNRKEIKEIQMKTHYNQIVKNKGIILKVGREKNYTEKLQ